MAQIYEDLHKFVYLKLNATLFVLIDLQVGQMRMFDSQVQSIYRIPASDTGQDNKHHKKTPHQSAWIHGFLGVKLGIKVNV